MKTEFVTAKHQQFVDCVVGVLRRPRFGIEVQSLDPDNWVSDSSTKYVRDVVNSRVFRITQNQYTYTAVFTFSKDSVYVSVRSEEAYKKEGNYSVYVFFTKTFKLRENGKMRKVGLVIANKMKMRVFHDISSV